MSAIAGLPIAWLVARSAGLVSFGALTGSVWMGLLMSTRILGPKRQASLLGLHRTLTWAGLAMLAVHMGALLVDPTMHFGLANVLIPFASPWRPFAVGVGVISGWISLVLALSFKFRSRIGTRVWRKLHYASFGAFLLMIVHALSSGTDLAGLAGPVVAAVAAGPVIFLTLLRVLMPKGVAPPRRMPAPAR
ncbi:MAG: hypothetical protein U0Y82_10645 [Thermoleophilia bacterium]